MRNFRASSGATRRGLRGERRGLRRAEERVDAIDEIVPAARALCDGPPSPAVVSRFTAFALLLAVVTAAYIEEPHGRSVQESSRATDKPGAKPKARPAASAPQLASSQRFASSELGKHVGKFGAGLSELMLGGTKR